MRKTVARWLESPVGVVGGSLLVTVALALAANLALDMWQLAGSGSSLAHYPMVDKPRLFLLGTGVVWLFVLLIFALLGRLWLSVGVVTVVTMLLGFANYRKLRAVWEPLYPSDLTFFSHPAFILDMVGPAVVAGALTGTVVVLCGAVLAGRLLRRRFGRQRGRRDVRVRWTLVGVRCVAVVAAVAAIASVLHFHAPGNWARAAYDSYGAHWRPWHQSANYTDNGFVAGMLYNLPQSAMRTPPGYDRETMRQVASRYTTVASRINEGRDTAALDDVNVVFVLGETFTDPTRIPDIELSEDPIPFTRSLMRRTTSGSMWSPDFGGGTANVEFEALTGMSLSQFRPQMTTPYQMLVPQEDTFPSAARALERRGHGSLALHSFTPALYRRAEVYPILGFDQAVFADQMRHTARVEDNPYISDEATYEEILDRLDKAEQPMFLNVVTMQNHYPMAGKYRDPIEATGPLGDNAMANLEHYARGLRYSDDAMRHLIGALEASPEKTVVVFYGDHLPPFWSPSDLSRRLAHQTPFFVYANFGHHPPRRLPTTSPIYFMNHVLDLTGAPVTPYYALLHELEQEVPALGHALMFGPDGRRLAAHDLSPRARRLLRDYRLVQYDLSVGERYSASVLLGKPGPR